MTEVTSREMHMVRAWLHGEDKEAQRTFEEQLAVAGEADGLAVLAYAAVLIAARRQFAPRYARDDVIRYVAHLRALLSERPGLLSPAVAEDELRAALGEQVTARHEVGPVAAARFCLLLALSASLQLDDHGIDGLLGQARDLADRMLADIRP